MRNLAQEIQSKINMKIRFFIMSLEVYGFEWKNVGTCESQASSLCKSADPRESIIFEFTGHFPLLLILIR